MPDSEKLKEKLRVYLSSLSDSAQQLLLRSLDHSRQQGTNDAASDMILDALTMLLKGDEPELLLEDQVRREFFLAAKPFLTEVDHVRKIEARISPSSLDAIWRWVVRDIASPEQKAQLASLVNGASDESLAAQTERLKETLVTAIHRYLKQILADFSGEQKLANQLGGEMIYKDLVDILSCEEKCASLRPIANRLPSSISSWSSPEGQEAYTIISRFIQGAPLKGAWFFSLITEKLASPQVKVKMATKLAGSDDAVQVAATVYAPAVDQIVGDMEGHFSIAKDTLSLPTETDSCVAALKSWRGLAKAMDVELEIPVNSRWGSSISQMKSQLSDLLARELEAVPGLVRQALRAPKSGASEKVDHNLLADAKRAVTLFHTIERIRDCLAVNGPLTRIRKELDQTFEILTTSLVERMRAAEGGDVDHLSQLGEAAAVYASLLIDENYANSFRRQLKAAASNQELVAAKA